jgi:hypothetical protein
MASARAASAIVALPAASNTIIARSTNRGVWHWSAANV